MLIINVPVKKSALSTIFKENCNAATIGGFRLMPDSGIPTVVGFLLRAFIGQGRRL
jgi:hypothetical protein